MPTWKECKSCGRRTECMMGCPYWRESSGIEDPPVCLFSLRQLLADYWPPVVPMR